MQYNPRGWRLGSNVDPGLANCSCLHCAATPVSAMTLPGARHTRDEARTLLRAERRTRKSIDPPRICSNEAASYVSACCLNTAAGLSRMVFRLESNSHRHKTLLSV